MRSEGCRSPTRIEQERCTSSLMCTEHAPHWAMPQPYFVPVSPACSRSAQSKGVSSSTLRSMVLPLTFSLAIRFLRSPHSKGDDRLNFGRYYEPAHEFLNE